MHHSLSCKEFVTYFSSHFSQPVNSSFNILPTFYFKQRAFKLPVLGRLDTLLLDDFDLSSVLDFSVAS